MTKFQVGAILTCLTMDGQMHTIGKAIRPLFADPVTYIVGIRESDSQNFPAASNNTAKMTLKFNLGGSNSQVYS